jgi:wyosine [tRNA(Phe)-imidazoG37] synthetase (radical SAM superfamily)
MDDKIRYRYLFGPVASRRLGRSLGVDLVPLKTCTFDCVYCQLGPASSKTVTRDEYVPAEDVLAELRMKLHDGPKPDYITLSGSGEPTLHTGLGEIIESIHEMTDVPVAVLTNGSLLYQQEVRAACCLADLVAPSLDAPNDELFQRINRPHPEMTFDRLIDGLTTFRDEFAGALWLEVFLIDGLNTSHEALYEFKRLFDRIRPDRIQINTAVRPTAEPDIALVQEPELRRIAELFGDRAEVIAAFPGPGLHGVSETCRNDVLDMLRRRPCSVQDVAHGLGINFNEALVRIRELETEGTVVIEQRDDTAYYRVGTDSGENC